MALDLSPLVSPYALIRPGYYVDETMSADTPRYLTIKSTMTSGRGASSFLTRLDLHQNSVVPGGQDDLLTVYTVVNGRNIQAFTDAQIAAEVDKVNTLLTAANITRLRRGEL